MDKDNFEKWLEEMILKYEELNQPERTERFEGKLSAYQNSLRQYRQFKQETPCKP